MQFCTVWIFRILSITIRKKVRLFFENIRLLLVIESITICYIKYWKLKTVAKYKTFGIFAHTKRAYRRFHTNSAKNCTAIAPIWCGIVDILITCNNEIIYFSYNKHDKDKKCIKVERIQIAIKHFERENFEVKVVIPMMRYILFIFLVNCLAMIEGGHVHFAMMTVSCSGLQARGGGGGCIISNDHFE